LHFILSPYNISENTSKMKSGIIVSLVIGVVFVMFIIYPMYTCKAPNGTTSTKKMDTDTEITMESLQQEQQEQQEQSDLKQHQSIVSNQINKYLEQNTEPNYLQDNYIIGTATLQPATQDI
jgi:amino acid permease